MHQRLEVVAHRLDVDVLVDQFDRLRAERVPEQLAVAARRLHRFIDLRQPAVVRLVRRRAPGRATAPPRSCRARCIPRRTCPASRCSGRHCCAAISPRSRRRCDPRRGRTPRHFCICTGSSFRARRCCDDHLLHGLLVEIERLRHVVEDADVVHDQAVGLVLAVGAVGAADRLQQVVVLHRLVEVHRLQDRRVEAGQQLAR